MENYITLTQQRDFYLENINLDTGVGRDVLAQLVK